MARSLSVSPRSAALYGALVLILLVLLVVPVSAATVSSASLSSASLSRASPTVINVDSTPQGATVQIDGTRAGITPIQKFAVSSGRHSIVLSLSGYQDYSTSFEITSGQDLTVSYPLTSSRIIVAKDTLVVVNKQITLVPLTTTPFPGNNVPWITGSLSTGIVHCPDHDYFVTFSGSTGNMSQGSLITIKIGDHPDNAQKTLPSQGVILGVIAVQSDRTYKMKWNGTVPGYPLKNGQEYVVYAIPPNQQYTKIGFLYQCENEQPWIGGTMSSGTLTCTEPGNKIIFSGSGGNLSTGIPITFEIFNMPPGVAQDLPVAGVELGTTHVQSDDTWKFTWQGGVNGYALTPAKDYMVKASLSPTNYLKFGVLYTCQPGDQWLGGGGPTPWNITCAKPADTMTFIGSSGNISEGTPIKFSIYDIPTSSAKILPDSGVIIGTTLVHSDGVWKFTWNGAVPGYTLKFNENYMVKAKLSETNYLKYGIIYGCQPGTAPADLLPETVLSTAKNTGTGVVNLAGVVPAVGSGISDSSSDKSSPSGEAVAVSPHLNPQPEPPSPLSPIFDFFNGLFGGSKKTSP
jgi:hypothetical protein